MRRANPASCLVLRGGGTALPVGRGSAAAAALGRLSLLLRHPAQLLWRQPPPTAPGVPRIAGVRALVAEGAMSEARPEKHDGRRHDSQDGVVLPNLSRFCIVLVLYSHYTAHRIDAYRSSRDDTHTLIMNWATLLSLLTYDSRHAQR